MQNEFHSFENITRKYENQPAKTKSRSKIAHRSARAAIISGFGDFWTTLKNTSNPFDIIESLVVTRRNGAPTWPTEYHVERMKCQEAATLRWNMELGSLFREN